MKTFQLKTFQHYFYVSDEFTFRENSFFWLADKNRRVRDL